MFEELSTVIAIKDITEGDEKVLAGSTGTIVDVNNCGYTVEFFNPEHIVISCYHDEIELRKKL